MKSRFLGELTTPEIEAYFEAGGKTALIPVGCTEMHGPHLPIATDTIQAEGFSLLLAEKVNALILPSIAYTWAGSTDGFAGTISISPELVRQLVTEVVKQTWKNGFRRIGLVSVHGSNDAILTLAIRRIFETLGIPVAYLNPFKAITEHGETLLSGKHDLGKEASLTLAALELLGKPDLYREEEMQQDETPPPLAESLRAFPFPVGYFMQDSRQHACPSPYISKARGLEFYHDLAEALVPHIEAIDQYLEEVQGQANRGWQTD